MSASHTPTGGADVFRITDFRRIDGEIHINIVTDDSTSALFLKLFKHAHEFAKLYDYKVSTEVGADLRQKERSDTMALARAARAEQLKSYRNLSGTRYERVRILKELRFSTGEDVTIDRILAELTLATKEEKESMIKQVGQLTENGHSLDFISKSLGIPKSTISRYRKIFQGGAAREDADVGLSNLVPLRSRKRRAP